MECKKGTQFGECKRKRALDLRSSNKFEGIFVLEKRGIKIRSN